MDDTINSHLTFATILEAKSFANSSINFASDGARVLVRIASFFIA